MTIHANRGVIGVTIHATVMTVRLRLVRMRRIPIVAGIDTGEDRIVGGINVAVGAHRAVVRNPEVSMVEYRSQPCSGYVGGVAAYTCRRV